MSIELLGCTLSPLLCIIYYLFLHLFFLTFYRKRTLKKSKKLACLIALYLLTFIISFLFFPKLYLLHFFNSTKFSKSESPSLKENTIKNDLDVNWLVYTILWMWWPDIFNALVFEMLQKRVCPRSNFSRICKKITHYLHINWRTENGQVELVVPINRGQINNWKFKN